MSTPSYLKDLEDSELTTMQAFRRTANQAQFIALKTGRITRYLLHELVTEEFDRLSERHKQEFAEKMERED